MKKQNKRGSYWKLISPEERTIRMAYVVSKRWKKTTLAQRQKYSRMMYKAKLAKNK